MDTNWRENGELSYSNVVWQGVADISLADRPAEKQRLFVLSSRKIYPDCRTVVICNGECPVDLISQPPKNLRA